jgi:hypothetical protein
MNNELLAICKQRGLTEEDLDELVYEAATAQAIPTVNEAETANGQEDILDDAEKKASRINNGGLDDQVAFLLAQNGFAETRKLLEEVEHEA